MFLRSTQLLSHQITGNLKFALIQGELRRSNYTVLSKLERLSSVKHHALKAYG